MTCLVLQSVPTVSYLEAGS